MDNEGNSKQPGRVISDESILKISKEIAVKFIEVGRLTPSTFAETFKDIHRTIENTIRRND
ncbi:MAG: hypothetical protein CSA26_08735 [Desulfobacterales bacterium]|nr:MAG: hypothetical protein CSA26_08735 [Desulfobacterales bacterium]